MPRSLTIQLTNGSSIEIDQDEWPQLGSAHWHSLHNDGDDGWELVVRKHADDGHILGRSLPPLDPG
jgi:hypothetical protein